MKRKPFRMIALALLLTVFVLTFSVPLVAKNINAIQNVNLQNVNPVIFVHGGSGSGAQFESQAMRFASNGYPANRITAFEYDSTFTINTYDDVYAKLDQHIAAVKAETGAAKVDVLGHSLGTTVMIGTDGAGGYMASPARAANIAHYVNIDGRTALALPGGVPTLALWAGLGTPGRQIVGATNVTIPNQTHVQTATSAESFVEMYKFFTGEEPATNTIVPEPPDQVRLAGRAVFFPQNKGVEGATVEMWKVDSATCRRVETKPAATCVVGEDGAWGPFKANGGYSYEFVIISEGASIHHFYSEPLIRSSYLVRLNTSPPTGGLGDWIDKSDRHSAINIMRYKEFWGDQDVNNDILTVNGVNVATPSLCPINRRVISFFAFDKGSDGVNNIGTPPFPFNVLSFLSGADFYIPAADPPAGTISVELTPRGGGGKKQVMNVPNWQSSKHMITVQFNDFVQDINTWVAPVPTTTSLSPTRKTAGQGAFTLTVNGTNFVSGLSKVRWNGTDRTTTFVSATQLTAAISKVDIATAGTVPVTVFNPKPGGGTSTPALVFTVDPVPVPTTTTLSPTSKIAGEASFTLTVNGGNFVEGLSVVRWNGADRSTTYVNSTQLTAAITAADIATAGTASVTVFNPAPGGGTSNAQTFTVASSTWYLAEGTTAWGFNTYITIQNPNSSAVTAKITYMDPNPEPNGKGRVFPPRQITLPPESQTTVDPRWDLGNTDFSTKVECLQGKTIAVDRTMFWTGPGAPSPEGHSSIGVTSPSTTWYLPEGSSAWGFETWTLVENPNAQDAHVTLTYMVEGQGSKTLTKTVPAYSRATYNMEQDLGEQADASIKVTADQPVIAEGSTYRNNRREGSCSVGATAPAKDYFLSEGSTAWGFTTYVLVENPNSEPTDVTLTYMTPEGPKAQPAFTMEANSRKTIRVNDSLANTDFSTQVHGTKPIIAERSVYWGAGTALGEACHASIGLSSAHMTFYLPDGQTSNGYETYTLVQNSNPGAVTVRVTYLPQGGGKSVTFTDIVPASSRKTYNMADKLPNGRAAIMVISKTTGKKIMVERAMYWNNRGAGTDTIGGYSD